MVLQQCFKAHSRCGVLLHSVCILCVFDMTGMHHRCSHLQLCTDTLCLIERFAVITAVVLAFVADDPPRCTGIRYIEENDYPVRGTYGFNQ